MSYLLDLTYDHPHSVPPARRMPGAGSIVFVDEILAFGETNSGLTWEKAFSAYQKSFVAQNKKNGRVEAK